MVAEAASDSVEYELVVFEPRFESWYQMQIGPFSDRSQAYYETWNERYVNAWNYHSYGYGQRFPLEPIIGYDPEADYGFEINRKLFYYFIYVERVKGIRLLPGSPGSMPF